MSAVDFNLGPFGIDAETNRSTCLGAFFNLNFGSGSKISWVVRRLARSPVSASPGGHRCVRGRCMWWSLTDAQAHAGRRRLPQERLLGLPRVAALGRLRPPAQLDLGPPPLVPEQLVRPCARRQPHGGAGRHLRPVRRRQPADDARAGQHGDDGGAGRRERRPGAEQWSGGEVRRGELGCARRRRDGGGAAPCRSGGGRACWMGVTTGSRATDTGVQVHLFAIAFSCSRTATRPREDMSARARGGERREPLSLSSRLPLDGRCQAFAHALYSL